MELNPNLGVFHNAAGCCGSATFMNANGEESETTVIDEKENATIVEDGLSAKKSLIKGIPNWILFVIGGLVAYKYIIK